MKVSKNPEDILRRNLLIGLSESKVGRYSMLHENAIWKSGYAHQDTIRLAYMYARWLLYYTQRSDKPCL